MMFVRALGLCAFAGIALSVSPVSAQDAIKYKVLATNKTSTMQKEMSDAAALGYKFAAVHGGETSFGGNEVVLVMQKTADSAPRYQYRLLATSKTSTMQQELQDAAEAGYDYLGQTVFTTTFGGQEVVCILQRDKEARERPRYSYRLLATKKTSTLEKELVQTGLDGYEVVGMTVGQTAMGGTELVAITRRAQ